MMTGMILCEYCIKLQDHLLMEGDGSQVMCDHLGEDNVDCTKLPRNADQAEKTKYVQTTFISHEEFLSKVAKHDAVKLVKCGDVATNVVFKMENISIFKMKYRERKVANLKKVENIKMEK